MTRFRRNLARLAFAASALILPSIAFAQEAPVPDEEKSDTQMVVGYIATGLLGTGAIFILCKSSRR